MRAGAERFRAALAYWLNRCRRNQLPPSGTWWLVWLLLAGRGFGKTRTGAEAVALRMVNRPGIRVALVAATFADGRDTMVEGESGLLAVPERYYGKGVHTWWNRSLGELILPNGSRAKVYSAEKPRQLRGPQHHLAWCDELAWWAYPRATWDALLFGLRLGEHPQIIVTTTPRPLALLRELVKAADTALTRGSTLDNSANLPPTLLRKLVEQYAGTATGRQELDGELLGEAEGARWSETLLARARRRVPLPRFDRVVVGMDPAVTTEKDSDRTGLAVVARGPAPEGWQPTAELVERAVAAQPDVHRELVLRQLLALPHLYVLHTEAKHHTPTKSCERAADLAELHDAEHVVIEANNGGDYLPTVLSTVAPGIRYRMVHAVGKKLERAEPLASLYDQDRVHHVGDHQDLEDDQLTYTGSDKDPSPDVLDAAVHAALDLVPPAPPKRGSRRKMVPAKLVGA